MNCPICGAYLRDHDSCCPNCGNYVLPLHEAHTDIVQEAARLQPGQTEPAQSDSPPSPVTKLYPPPELDPDNRDLPQEPDTVPPETPSEGEAAEEEAPETEASAETEDPSADGEEKAAGDPGETEADGAAASPEAVPVSETPAEDGESPSPPDSQAVPHEAAAGRRVRRSSRRLNRWRVFAVVSCLAAVFGLVLSGYYIYRCNSMIVELNKAKKERSNAVASMQTLQNQISELQQSLDARISDNASLEDQINDLTGQMTNMENTVTQNTYDKETAERELSEALSDLDKINEMYTETQNTLTETQEENETLQSENETLTSEKEELEKKYSSLQVTASAYENEIAFYDENVVLVQRNDNNRYYHKYGCSDYNTSNFLAAYSVRLAEASGYTACPKCIGGTESGTNSNTNSNTSGTFNNIFSGLFG